MLDAGSMDYTYSMLATSALCHTQSLEVALEVSGFTWPDIKHCVIWMYAFVLALRERPPIQYKSFSFRGIYPGDAHHVQVPILPKYLGTYSKSSVVDPKLFFSDPDPITDPT